MAKPPCYIATPDRLGEKQRTAMVLTFQNEEATMARYLVKTAKGLWYMGEYSTAQAHSEDGATEEDAWSALEATNGDVRRAVETLRGTSSRRAGTEETGMQVDTIPPAPTT
ncbi:hypothetical protein FRC05_007719 [Tulasnella sp. 425]|nr:hypothetical protein FRC05_007719 [Tulasnella sp. 425]